MANINNINIILNGYQKEPLSESEKYFVKNITMLPDDLLAYHVLILRFKSAIRHELERKNIATSSIEDVLKSDNLDILVKFYSIIQTDTIDLKP